MQGTRPRVDFQLSHEEMDNSPLLCLGRDLPAEDTKIRADGGIHFKHCYLGDEL